jgi:hypothetical protein
MRLLKVARHIAGHFGIPCEPDLAEAILEDPKLKGLRDVVLESLSNVKEETRWMSGMTGMHDGDGGHMYDCRDHYFKNHYLGWNINGAHKQRRQKTGFDLETELNILYSPNPAEMRSLRDRTSWRRHRRVHIPTSNELRAKGMSDISRFFAIAEAVFQSNPLEYLRDNAREIVDSYGLYKALNKNKEPTTRST